MAMNLLPVLLLGGAALLLMRGGKEEEEGDTGENGTVDPILDPLLDPKTGDGSGFSASDVGETGPREVGVSPNMEIVEVGDTWYVNVLDKWLDERRDAGLLMTKKDAEGWWYTTFVANPQSALGYVFTLGDEDADQQSAGEFVYAALWTAIVVGTGLRGISRRMTKRFLAKSSRVDAAVLTANQTKVGYGDTVVSAAGIVVAGAELSEDNEGMAASSVEAFSDFMGSDAGTVSWFGPTADDVELAKIDDLGETDAVLAFKRSIMAYILNFQKRTFAES